MRCGARTGAARLRDIDNDAGQWRDNYVIAGLIFVGTSRSTNVQAWYTGLRGDSLFSPGRAFYGQWTITSSA